MEISRFDKKLLMAAFPNLLSSRVRVDGIITFLYIIVYIDDPNSPFFGNLPICI